MEDRFRFLVPLIGFIFLFLGIITSISLLVLQKREDWKDYDSYILSFYWAPTFCLNKERNNEECYQRLDDLGINNSFIIRGLWPTYSSGEYIENCNPNDEINIAFNEPDDYEERLTTFWPGLHESDNKQWNHEYNRHGYCYVKRIGKNPEKDYKEYFDKTLNIVNDINHLMEVILPDTPQGFHTITKKKFQKFIYNSFLIEDSTYSLRCVEDKFTKKSILSEIWFNYDINFERTKKSKLVDNCPDKFELFLINENKKPVWELTEYYIFAGVWMPTFCREMGQACYKDLKKRILKYPDLLNNLTIHGLWPSFLNSKEHQWCNIDEDIEILNYTKEMEIYWNHLEGDNNIEFWQNQYNEQGFCYNKILKQSTNDYFFYFNETMRIYDDKSVKVILKDFKKDLFPGIHEIQMDELNEYLNIMYGKNHHYLTCKNFNGKYFLYEIRLYFRFNEIWRDSKSESGNCTDKIYIEYLDVEGPQEEDGNLYKNYDMYYFTISWLNTFCQIKGPQCYDNIKNVKNKFTIHGLWPYLKNLENINSLKWCNGKNDIYIDIKNEELFNFTNQSFIHGYHTNEYFWGHEYNKHGYCYNKRNNFNVNDTEIYFQKINDIFVENKFDDIFIDFFDNKIETGDIPINRTEFENFLEIKGFPKDSYLIVCENITILNENLTYPHILEMRIRYDLDFNLFINENDKSEFDCPDIFYAQFS